MKILFLVGLGGFLGSVSRYGLSHYVDAHMLSSFPYGTMLVNIAGCFIIGIIYALSTDGGVTPEARLLLATGFCGGFTTFSSFSYESITLLQDGQFLYAFAYSGLSLLIGFAATFLGIVLIKSL